MQVYVVNNESPQGDHSIMVGIYSSEEKASEMISFLERETPGWYPTYSVEDVDPEEPIY
jgi:hypothetical protein